MDNYKYESEEEKEVFEYLDSLRESGVTNMFGAAPYVQREFTMRKSLATKYLLSWMDTFHLRHPE